MVARQMESLMEEIISHDRAEKNDAYAGQVNMLPASPLSGLNSAIWGYDIARHDGLTAGTIVPTDVRTQADGSQVPLLPAGPLLEAGELLFGSESTRRYPLLPGTHVHATIKELTAPGPNSVWAAIAVAVARDREHDASLFTEEVGQDPFDQDADRGRQTIRRRMDALVDRTLAEGAATGVSFREIFLGFKSRQIPKGYIGTALACVPCVVLARDAVPEPAGDRLSISLSQWKDQHRFSDPRPEDRTHLAAVRRRELPLQAVRSGAGAQ
jgi:histidine decarboxylase